MSAEIQMRVARTLLAASVITLPLGFAAVAQATPRLPPKLSRKLCASCNGEAAVGTEHCRSLLDNRAPTEHPS